MLKSKNYDFRKHKNTYRIHRPLRLTFDIGSTTRQQHPCYFSATQTLSPDRLTTQRIMSNWYLISDWDLSQLATHFPRQLNQTHHLTPQNTVLWCLKWRRSQKTLNILLTSLRSTRSLRPQAWKEFHVHLVFGKTLNGIYMYSFQLMLDTYLVNILMKIIR